MSTTSAPKKKPTCTNCQVCGHNSKNCPENPFVFYANHKFPKVTQLLSKQLPQKIKTQKLNCSLCDLPLNSDKTVVQTSCHHFFHNDCLADSWNEQWAEHGSVTCPTCDQNYTIDYGYGEFDIESNAKAVLNRQIAEMKYQEDVKSQARRLTNEEIELLLKREEPRNKWSEEEKAFLRKQLKFLEYDKKYKGYYTTGNPEIGIYDQAKERLQTFNRPGSINEPFQPANPKAIENVSKYVFQKTHPELVREVFEYLKPNDDPNVVAFYEEQLQNKKGGQPFKKTTFKKTTFKKTTFKKTTFKKGGAKKSGAKKVSRNMTKKVKK